jgi:chemotaxis protein MotB
MASPTQANNGARKKLSVRPVSRRKKSGDGHDESHGESWLMTYADTITNLLGFFVLIVSVSTIDMNKFAKVSDSVKEQMKSQELTITSMTKLKKRLDSMMKDKVATGALNINMDAQGIRMTASNASFFNSGEAILLPEGQKIIDQITDQIRKINDDFNIDVEGHTDNTPISSSKYATNWELSADRASQVVRYMIEKGISKDHIKSSAFADTRPLMPNEDKDKKPIAENKARNRRVVIRVFY